MNKTEAYLARKKIDLEIEAKQRMQEHEHSPELGICKATPEAIIRLMATTKEEPTVCPKGCIGVCICL